MLPFVKSRSKSTPDAWQVLPTSARGKRSDRRRVTACIYEGNRTREHLTWSCALPINHIVERRQYKWMQDAVRVGEGTERRCEPNHESLNAIHNRKFSAKRKAANRESVNVFLELLLPRSQDSLTTEQAGIADRRSNLGQNYWSFLLICSIHDLAVVVFIRFCLEI